MSEDRQHLAEGWHLDKRVPIAIIGAIIGQGAMIIWWAAGVDARLSTAAHRLDVIERIADRGDAADRMVADRLTRLETQQTMMVDQLREIKAILGRRSDLNSGGPVIP